MQKKWLGIVTATALMSGFSFTATAAPPDMDHVPLTLSGCVVAGEAKDSYLLTNVVVDGTTHRAHPSVLPLQHHKGAEGPRRPAGRSAKAKPISTTSTKARSA